MTAPIPFPNRPHALPASSAEPEETTMASEIESELSATTKDILRKGLRDDQFIEWVLANCQLVDSDPDENAVYDLAFARLIVLARRAASLDAGGDEPKKTTMNQFEVSAETLAELASLKKRYDVTSNTEVLRCVLADAKKTASNEAFRLAIADAIEMARETEDGQFVLNDDDAVENAFIRLQDEIIRCGASPSPTPCGFGVFYTDTGKRFRTCDTREEAEEAVRGEGRPDLCEIKALYDGPVDAVAVVEQLRAESEAARNAEPDGSVRQFYMGKFAACSELLAALREPRR